MDTCLIAGRELDALILSRVMGQKYVFLDTPLPHYSTDIAAAWQVVEKLKKEDRPFELRHTYQGSTRIYHCEFGPWVRGGQRAGEPLGEGEAPTAPLAICLAALQVVGHE